MTYETKDNTGRLFRVEEDKKRERGPDYSGTAVIEGVEYFMDAWLKTSESGRKWMSFSFKAKTKQPVKDTRTHGERKRPSSLADMEDDVPF